MEYDMIQVWKTKIAELELQKELMLKDKQFTEKDISNMDEMIESAKKAMMEEIKKSGTNNKSR